MLQCKVFYAPRSMFEMAEQNIYSIILKITDNKFYLGKTRDENWNIISIPKNERELKKMSAKFNKSFKKIIHKIEGKDGVLGFVEIYVTDKFLNQSLHELNDILNQNLTEFVKSIIAQIMILSIVILILIFGSIKFIILLPLAKFTHVFAEGAKGDLTVRMSYDKSDEIGGLAEDFNILMSNLNTASENLINSKLLLDSKISIIESILKGISDPLFVCDNEGIITFMNESCGRILGYLPREVIGKLKCREVFKSGACGTDCLLEACKKSGKPIIGKEINLINRNGDMIPVSISAATLKDSEGKIIGGLETFRDLTRERKMLDLLIDITQGKIKSKISTSTNKLSCWNVKYCGETDCPSYKNENYSCWTVEGTHCNGSIQTDCRVKLESCRKCEVYRETLKNTIDETIDALNQALETFKEIIKASENIANGKINSAAVEIELDKGKNINEAAEIKSMMRLKGDIKEAFVEMQKKMRILNVQANIISRDDLNNPLFKDDGCSTGVISGELKKMTDKLLSLSATARLIAEGDLNNPLIAFDSKGTLGSAFEKMTENLRNTVEIAKLLANGDLTVSVKKNSDNDLLGAALQNMLTNLLNIVKKILESAEEVASGSRQISITSEHIAAGATEQSKSVDEG